LVTDFPGHFFRLKSDEIGRMINYGKFDGMQVIGYEYIGDDHYSMIDPHNHKYWIKK
jgi:hypothetical protein